MKTVALVLFGLSTSMLHLPAFANEQLKALQGEPVHVLSAEIVTSGSGEFWTKIEIYATATFSNECFTPDTFVAIGDYAQGDIQLVGANPTDRVCATVYDPVTKRILVRTLYTDMMPIVRVNGVPAKMTH